MNWVQKTNNTYTLDTPESTTIEINFDGPQGTLNTWKVKGTSSESVLEFKYKNIGSVSDDEFKLS